MGWMEFVASLVGSIAWPAVAGVGLWLFRDSLRKVFTSASGRLALPGGAELEWQNASADAAVGAVTAAVASTPREPTPESDKLAQLVELDPAAAILSAYGAVWQSLRPATGGEHIGLRAVRAAYDAGRIRPETARALEGLQVLRNLAAHEPERVTTEKAADYVALSEATRYALEVDLSSAASTDPV